MNKTTSVDDAELRAIADHLRSTGKALATWASALARCGDEDHPDLARSVQIGRVAALIEEAVSTLDTPADELPVEPPPALPTTQAQSLMSTAAARSLLERYRELAAHEALGGDSASIPVSDFLSFVSNLRKSGIIFVESEEENFLLQLERGTVAYAQGDHPPQGLRLGEILVAQGAVDRSSLDRLLERDGEGPYVLGRQLVEEELITEDALRIALSYQVQHVFYRVHAVGKAHYHFEEGVQHLRDSKLRLNVTQLLLESARTMDERLAAERERDAAAH